MYVITIIIIIIIIIIEVLVIVIIIIVIQDHSNTLGIATLARRESQDILSKVKWGNYEVEGPNRDARASRFAYPIHLLMYEIPINLTIFLNRTNDNATRARRASNI